MKQAILILSLLSLSLSAEAGRRENLTSGYPPPSSSPRHGGFDDVVHSKRGQGSGGGDNGGGGGVTDPGQQPRK
jgi:hypothetical protein